MNRIYIESTTIDNEGDTILEVSHCSCTEEED